ncbi:hypothetical protein FI667_g16719, partial [Globisporangium splendens]
MRRKQHGNGGAEAPAAPAAEDEGIDAQELAHLLSDDDRDSDGNEGSNENASRSTRQALFTGSVLAIFSTMTSTAGDECDLCGRLGAELMQLPRESNVLSLVTLLHEIREEYIPREALMSIWRKLHSDASTRTNHAKATKRAKSAAAIPIVRSRMLEVGFLCVSAPAIVVLICLMHCDYRDDDRASTVEAETSRVRPQTAAKPHFPAPAHICLRALNQQEESKARKRIVQTNDRAQEILHMREANTKKQEQKSIYALQREQETRSVQKKQHHLKKESVVKKKHAAIQIISKKYQDVELVKSESQRLKA